jgi:hypothetical protein
LLLKLTFFNRYHPALLALDRPILKVACLRLTHQVLLHRLPPHSVHRDLGGFLTLPPLQVMLAAGALQDVLLLGVVPARRTVLVVELRPLGRRVRLPSIGRLLVGGVREVGWLVLLELIG